MDNQIAAIDPNFAVNTEAFPEGMRFYNAKEAPFTVYGVMPDEDCFRRLPEDVAKAVVALCDGTFGYTTGQSLILDGGMHIRKL